MSGSSSMHGNSGSSVVTSSGQPPGGLNGVKLEGSGNGGGGGGGYYCNSYTPPTPVEHGGLLPPSYSK